MIAGVQWAAQVRDLLREAIDHLPERSRPAGQWASLEPAPDHGPGWFTVCSRLTPEQVEALGDGWLSRKHDVLEPDARGPAVPEHDVLEVVVAADEIRVRTAVTAKPAELELQVPAPDPRRVLVGLAAGLETVREGPLLAGFTDEALTPVPPGVGELRLVPGWNNLNPAQKDAVTACCAPGLQLVWGPPRTGKSHVVAAAVSQLARTGHRVLLLSPTAITLDTALDRGVRLMRPEPGAVIRIGGIHRPAKAADEPARADDEGVRLARLVEVRQSEMYQRAAELEQRILSLTQARDALAAVRAELAEFDVAGYRRASRRVANRAAYERQQHDVVAEEAEVEQVRQDLAERQKLLLALVCREARESRDRTRDLLSATESELSRREQRFWSRRRHRRTIKRLRATRLELVEELARAAAVLNRALDDAGQAGVDPAASGDLGRPEVEGARDAASGRLRAASALLARIREELTRLSRLDLGESADQALVTDQWQLWNRHNQLPTLVGQAEQEQQQRAALGLEYEQLRQQIRRERTRLEQEIVAGARVVATTLTQLALHPWITQEPFDHVIVDDAAAAQLPHVLHAVGRAGIGAALIGDPLQNGPRIDDGFPGSERVQNLFATDCFGFFGVTDPVAAKARPGCVVLTEQFRVGSPLTELANRVGYQGLLTTREPRPGKIVVVTVDGLPPALRTVSRGGRRHPGWWAIGTLLGRALAEYHDGRRSNEAFAVVVPSRAQAEATAAVLDEAGLRSPAGTAPAFPGRQFDTVLADLVEDGEGALTQLGPEGDGDGHAADDLRQFNVAATRARKLLYVLLTARALENAGSGPLEALKDMVGHGQAERVDLGSLFDGLGERPAAGSAEAELVTALAPYLRVADRPDEDAAVEEVIARIGAARTSLWCWSPWEGRQAVAIFDALDHAQRRGVDVHVIARPVDQVKPGNRWSLEGLEERLPHTVFMRDLHQRIVIADRRMSTVGMFAPETASSPELRDFVITVAGTTFAKQILFQEMAGELARRRRCRQCDEPLRQCRETGTAPARRWVWLCDNRDDEGNRHRLAFPDRRQPPGRSR